MKELSSQEIDQVSGASFFGAIGNLLMAGVDASNGFFNTVAPIGLFLNLIPFVKPVHELGDLIIFGVQNFFSSIGFALGGRYTPVNKSHFTSEWQS